MTLILGKLTNNFILKLFFYKIEIKSSILLLTFEVEYLISVSNDFSNTSTIEFSSKGLNTKLGSQAAYIYGRLAPITLQPFSIASTIPKPKLSANEGYIRYSEEL